jgi:YD repeat-containing protein
VKKILLAAISITLLASLVASAGRGNLVTHVDTDGVTTKVIWASQGSCVHHLTAHPLDTVATVAGASFDPTNCN